MKGEKMPHAHFAKKKHRTIFNPPVIKISGQL